jgi:hypothetical protein
MANTGLDMQVFRNTNDGIALLEKKQDKSSIGSEQGQSAPFSSILDEKTAQASNNECDIEKDVDDTDHGTTYAGFAAVPAPVPVPFGMAHQLLKAAPHSVTDNEKSLSLINKAKSATVSPPNVKTIGDFTGELGKNSLSSSDEANTSVLSNPDGKKTELKQVIPPNPNGTSQTEQTRENAANRATALASEIKINFNNEIDQSDIIPTLEPPAVTSRNKVTSTISLTTETTSQADQVVTNNIVHKAISAASDMTIGDLPKMTDRIRAEKSKHQLEKGLFDRVTERLQQKKDSQTVDGLFSDIRRTTVSAHDNTTRTAFQRDREYHSTTAQKPMAVINDKVAAISPSSSEGLSQDTLTDTAVFMKTAPASITAQDRDNQQKWNAAADQHLRMKGDEIPFHTEMTNTQSTRGNLSSVTNGPSGINTQAVIDQIMDAKQALNNGFGRVRITLDPPNLGTVNLEIVIRKERVEVVMTADNAGVQQALQSRADDIRTALQRQDLKIETFQVLLQNNTANQQQANSGSMFGQRQENQARQNLVDDSIPIQPIREFEPMKGLVSIFA